MIGKLCVTTFPYYDKITKRQSYKNRPALVIGGPRNNDYTILPLSTITNAAMIDPEYDIRIEPSVYPKLNLKKTSYIRTHKQSTVHSSSVTTSIADIKTDYPALYQEVWKKLDKYNQHLQANK